VDDIKHNKLTTVILIKTSLKIDDIRIVIDIVTDSYNLIYIPHWCPRGRGRRCCLCRCSTASDQTNESTQSIVTFSMLCITNLCLNWLFDLISDNKGQSDDDYNTDFIIWHIISTIVGVCVLFYIHFIINLIHYFMGRMSSIQSDFLLFNIVQVYFNKMVVLCCWINKQTNRVNYNKLSQTN